MTDLSSKGLLPQLTELLHALSDSHELLLLKIQSLRWQQMSSDPMVVADYPSAPFVSIVSPRAAVVVVETKASVWNDVDVAIPIDPVNETDALTGQKRPYRFEAEISPDVTAEPAGLTDADATVAPSTATETPAGDHPDPVVRDQAPTQPDWPSTTYADPADGGSVNRDYNFFDELDARLAGLENSDADPADN